VADNESDIELHNGIEVPESPEKYDVSAEPIVPGLIRIIWRSKIPAEQKLIAVSARDMRRNMVNQKKLDTMCQYFFIRFFMLVDQ
jgi:hypothetical protein